MRVKPTGAGIRHRSGDVRAWSHLTARHDIEVTGEKKKDKAAKVSTARTLWVPAINNHGGFGRWAFLEVADPWDAKNAIRRSLAMRVPAPV